MAIVLTFDGAVGSVSEVVDGLYTGRAGRPVHLPRGQGGGDPRARRGARASTSRRAGRTPTRSPTCRCCARVGHPVAVNPDRELARVAREEGWEVLRFDRIGRQLKLARRAPRSRAAVGGAVSLRRSPARRAGVSRARALRRAAGDPRARAPLRRRGRRARRAGLGPRAPLPARGRSRRLGELGLMGVCVPEEHGGAGADFLSYVLVHRGDLARRRRRWAPRWRSTRAPGRCRSSPTARPSRSSASCRRSRAARSWRPSRSPRRAPGSDASALRTRADDDRITGTKQWITNGSHAQVFSVFARDGRADLRLPRARAGAAASR